MAGNSSDKSLTGENEFEMSKEDLPGSENLEVISDDEQESGHGKMAKRKKKYQRHTPYQINALEGFFKENSYPSKKLRSEIAERLGMESSKVGYWFQNRRTQGKAKKVHEDNPCLRDEQYRLLTDNLGLKEAMKNPSCTKCGGPATLSDLDMELYYLQIENSRIKEKLYRVSCLASQLGLDTKVNKAL